MSPLLFVLACRSVVCTTDPDTLPVVRGTEAEEQTLDGVWQTFAEAIEPSQLCLSAVEVWSVKEWRVEGRYRSVRRNIWVGQDDLPEMATAVRHEMCHAYDQQVLGGRPPGEDFTVDVRLAGAHPGKIPAREAFAWTCSLEPTLLPAYAAASCEGDDTASSFAYVVDEVYRGQPPGPVIDVHRLEVTSDELDAMPPIVGVEALVATTGSVAVVLSLEGTAETEVVWIDLEERTAQRQPPDGSLEILSLAPEGTRPPTSSLALPFATARSDRTEVAMVEVALLSGYTRRLIARRDGGDWGAAPDACGVSLDGRTSFFLLGSDRALTSVSALEGNRLVVLGWDGPLSR
ncbi:MAG: hypothetical protein AAF211_13520 [Myxococcota bacterium]